MKSLSRTVALLVGVGVAIGVASAQAPNPNIGTWRLNAAKSSFSPGPGPQSQTLRFEAWDGGLKVTSDSIDAKGNKVHSEFAAKFDGKPYPYTGNPDADMVTMKLADARTIDYTWTLRGKPTMTLRAVVAADGKTRTVTSTGVNAAGQKVNNTSVYDRQ